MVKILGDPFLTMVKILADPLLTMVKILGDLQVLDISQTHWQNPPVATQPHLAVWLGTPICPLSHIAMAPHTELVFVAVGQHQWDPILG